METGEFIAWRVAQVFDPKISTAGKVELLNKDKFVTFAHAAQLFEIPRLGASSVLLIDEGCDNGDILAYAIPWIQRGDIKLNVLLTNGHEGKLTTASKVAN